MPAKRPPAIQEKVYVEIDKKAYEEDGVFSPVGTPIYAPMVTTKVPRGNFEIVYTSELFQIMRELGSKKIDVFTYLLDHKDGNNSLNTNMRRIADECGVSLPTVSDTIQVLRSAGLLKREGSVYTLSARLMVKGSQVREAYLMRRYEAIDDNTKKPALEDKTIDAVDAQLEGQYEILNTDMEIGERAH